MSIEFFLNLKKIDSLPLFRAINHDWIYLLEIFQKFSTVIRKKNKLDLKALYRKFKMQNIKNKK